MEENKDRLKMFYIASLKEPYKLAHYIYFIMKKYPKCIFCTDYIQSLIYLKNKLIREYQWDLSDINKCYNLLEELSKYKNLNLDKKK